MSQKALAGLHYWHPIVSSKKLPPKYLVKILGRELVLVTNKNGRFAIERACPHRGMDMMEGLVTDEGIVCPFHNWHVSSNGEVRDSLGNGVICKQQRRYQVEEYLGFIWLRELDVQEKRQQVPKLDFYGHRHIYSKLYEAKSSLDVVVDIFNEAEHTADTHRYLGYKPDSKKNLVVDVIIGDRFVQSINKGQQKRIPFPVSIIMPFKNGDYFRDEFLTEFEPVRTCYRHYWYDPLEKQVRDFSLIHYMFFVARNTHETNIVLFSFMHHRLLGYPVIGKMIVGMMNRFTDVEMYADMEVVKKIIHNGLPNNHHRFDKALKPIREKIEKIYLKKPIGEKCQ